MGRERIDLAQFFGTVRKTAFATVGEPLHRYCKITTGVLADGRFFAERVGRTAPGRPGDAAYVFYSEEQAVRVADGWIADGRRWEQVPAQWDGKGQPADNWPWHQIGNRWVMGHRPEDG